MQSTFEQLIWTNNNQTITNYLQGVVMKTLQSDLIRSIKEEMVQATEYPGTEQKDSNASLDSEPVDDGLVTVLPDCFTHILPPLQHQQISETKRSSAMSRSSIENSEDLDDDLMELKRMYFEKKTNEPKRIGGKPYSVRPKSFEVFTQTLDFSTVPQGNEKGSTSSSQEKTPGLVNISEQSLQAIAKMFEQLCELRDSINQNPDYTPMSFTRAKEYATGSGLQPEHLEIYINDATICLSNLSKEMSAAKEKQSLDPVNEDISSHSSGYNSNDEKDQLSSRFTPFEKEVRPPQVQQQTVATQFNSFQENRVSQEPSTSILRLRKSISDSKLVHSRVLTALPEPVEPSSTKKATPKETKAITRKPVKVSDNAPKVAKKSSLADRSTQTENTQTLTPSEPSRRASTIQFSAIKQAVAIDLESKYKSFESKGIQVTLRQGPHVVSESTQTPSYEDKSGHHAKSKQLQESRQAALFEGGIPVSDKIPLSDDISHDTRSTSSSLSGARALETERNRDLQSAASMTEQKSMDITSNSAVLIISKHVEDIDRESESDEATPAQEGNVDERHAPIMQKGTVAIRSPRRSKSFQIPANAPLASDVVSERVRSSTLNRADSSPRKLTFKAAASKFASGSKSALLLPSSKVDSPRSPGPRHRTEIDYALDESNDLSEIEQQPRPVVCNTCKKLLCTQTDKSCQVQLLVDGDEEPALSRAAIIDTFESMHVAQHTELGSMIKPSAQRLAEKFITMLQKKSKEEKPKPVYRPQRKFVPKYQELVDILANANPNDLKVMKTRHWLHRFMKDVYLAKYNSDQLSDRNQYERMKMGAFFLTYMKNRYGSKKMAEQQSTSIIVSAQMYRMDDDIVNTFMLFLEETYPLDVLSPFLKVMNLLDTLPVGVSYPIPPIDFNMIPRYVCVLRCEEASRMVLGPRHEDAETLFLDKIKEKALFAISSTASVPVNTLQKLTRMPSNMLSAGMAKVDGTTANGRPMYPMKIQYGDFLTLFAQEAMLIQMEFEHWLLKLFKEQDVDGDDMIVFDDFLHLVESLRVNPSLSTDKIIQMWECGCAITDSSPETKMIDLDAWLAVQSQSPEIRESFLKNWSQKDQDPADGVADWTMVYQTLRSGWSRISGNYWNRIELIRQYPEYLIDVETLLQTRERIETYLREEPEEIKVMRDYVSMLCSLCLLYVKVQLTRTYHRIVDRHLARARAEVLRVEDVVVRIFGSLESPSSLFS
eukprot:TRINITY_DN5830_c0_g1_i6.p1 TRINITY_DN5830_c0_g1~~TRINITY_DN5830_c0_g1_i6.p1  ORF type:complete len:1224 (+),score=234.98 TRINITY_DN5830_c0_g1_i6:88-3759(+)